MQDEPTPAEILQSVASFLRNEIIVQLHGASAFQLRVAVNALDLVGREISLAPGLARDELAGLRSLLGEDGTVEQLTAHLATGIATGSIDPAAPDVEAFLWSSTEAKLAVDQPGYAGLARARARKAIHR